MTLVERVIDTKINLGYESVEDREKLLAEHAGRTASSLADTLRDLAKLPEKKSRSVEVPEITSEAEVIESGAKVDTIGKEEGIKVQSDPKESFEQVLVDTLMGRRKL